jgi:hypothetical protein
MCNLNVVLQYEKYIDVRRRYLKKYYWQMLSCFKLIQLLSVCNIKELNNLGKYLLLAEKIRNYCRVTSHYVIDQSLISICDVKKMFGCEAKDNPQDSTNSFFLFK